MLEIVGTANLSPYGCGGLTTTVSLDGKKTYSAERSGSGGVAGTDLSPAQLDQGSIANIKFILLKSLRNDLLVALLSNGSGGGIDQRVPFDRILFLQADKAPYSTIRIVGTGMIEYLLAGY